VPLATGTAGRGGILWFVACGLLVVLGWLLSQDPLIERRLFVLAHPLHYVRRADPSARLDQDPRAGTLLAGTPGAGRIRAAAGSARGPYLLVYVGERLSCMTANLGSWRRDADELGTPVILFGSASAAAMRQVCKEHRLERIHTVPFVDAATLRRLNTIATPRAYLYSNEWRLLWCQQVFGESGYSPARDPELLAALRRAGR
jgi:hypothetical protein